ncbi:MAG: hypothetical protein Q2484_15555 [Candidatus Sedimenticola sp. (ex Thyasira tokunagai)]
MKNDDPLNLKDFEKKQQEAREREAKRDSLRKPLEVCVQQIVEAENVAAEKKHSYEFQCKITKAKSELLSILESLEKESSNPSEIILLMESER